MFEDFGDLADVFDIGGEAADTASKVSDAVGPLVDVAKDSNIPDFISWVNNVYGNTPIDYTQGAVPYWLNPANFGGQEGGNFFDFLRPYGDSSLTPSFNTAAPYTFDPTTGQYGAPGGTGSLLDRLLGSKTWDKVGQLAQRFGSAAGNLGAANNRSMPYGNVSTGGTTLNFQAAPQSGAQPSPIDFAAKGAEGFMQFLNLLSRVPSLLYNDKGMRLNGTSYR